MGGVFLVDTDATLALTHSSIGQQFLKKATSLRVAEGVWNEITTSRQNDPATSDMAVKAETCLNANTHVEIVKTRMDAGGGDYGYGEQSIEDAIWHSDVDISRVFFFDDDLEPIIETASNRDNPPKFNIFSKVVTISAFGLSQREQEDEVLRMAGSRNWRTREQLYSMLVDEGITPKKEFDYQALRARMRSLDSDL